MSPFYVTILKSFFRKIIAANTAVIFVSMWSNLFTASQCFCMTKSLRCSHSKLQIELNEEPHEDTHMQVAPAHHSTVQP